MKTKKIIISALAVLLVGSCATPYKMVRMITTIDRNGKVHREIYANDRSVEAVEEVEESGKKISENEVNTSKKTFVDVTDTSFENPFLFNLTSDWKITYFDTAIKYNFFGDEGKFRMKISKDANSIEQYSREIQCDEAMQSLAVPKESLAKKNRWFYTYYSFKTVYKKLKYELPIPISDYLTKEEQMLWTQGNMSSCRVKNGCEMKDYLNRIDGKFWKWYGRNCFEISFEAIKKLTTGYDLDTIKENIYDEICKAEDGADPKSVCIALDSFYVTTYFSELYTSNKEILDKDFEKVITVVDMANNIISYELVIPDKVLQTNAPIINSDTLVWKVDGMRLLFDNYTLTAEYRIINTWAFAVTALLITAAAGSSALLVKRRRAVA